MSGERISSGTFFYKRVFPALWLVLMVYFVVVGFIGDQPHGQSRIGLFVAVAFIGGVGVFTLRKYILDLADEVILNGDMLLVRKGGEQERIRLADVINVNVTPLGNPRRITLRLSKACRFGDEVAFIPRAKLALNFNPLARDPVAEKLIGLTDAARRGETPR